MIVTLVTTMVLLMALMAGWIEVQRAARRLALQTPEFGPPRLVGGGCGGHCGDCEDSCETTDPLPATAPAHAPAVEESR